MQRVDVTLGKKINATFTIFEPNILTILVAQPYRPVAVTDWLEDHNTLFYCLLAEAISKQMS